MILNEIKNFCYFSKFEHTNINSLYDNFEEDKLYQIDVNVTTTIKNVYVGKLTPDNIYIGDVSYPDNALQINLQRGHYVLVYEKGAIIKTSKGDTDPNSNIFDFKTTGNSKLYVWQTDVNNYSFEIYKVTQNKKTLKISSTFFELNDNSKLFFNQDASLYNIKISEVINDTPLAYTPKYPHGTYDIIFHENINKFITDAEFNNIKTNDLKNFDIENGKLTSLRNINIPQNVNPISHYCFIGKLDLLIYIDFNNDKYYMKPTGYAEAFANLFVPDRIVEEIELTEEHALVHVVDYQIISNVYMNHELNMLHIKKWIECEDKMIHNENELFYYIENFGLYDWYYSRYYDIIEKYFMYINLYEIEARIDDDVSQTVSSKDLIMPYTITTCKWKYDGKSSTDFNHIKWDYSGKWKDGDQFNKVYFTVQGNATIKITKKHFMNLTNVVDINENISGNLSDDQFRELYLNKPKVNPFNRLQYWEETQKLPDGPAVPQHELPHGNIILPDDNIPGHDQPYVAPEQPSPDIPQSTIDGFNQGEWPSYTPGYSGNSSSYDNEPDEPYNPQFTYDQNPPDNPYTPQTYVPPEPDDVVDVDPPDIPDIPPYNPPDNPPYNPPSDDPDNPSPGDPDEPPVEPPPSGDPDNPSPGDPDNPSPGDDPDNPSPGDPDEPPVEPPPGDDPDNPSPGDPDNPSPGDPDEPPVEPPPSGDPDNPSPGDPDEPPVEPRVNYRVEIEFGIPVIRYKNGEWGSLYLVTTLSENGISPSSVSCEFNGESYSADFSIGFDSKYNTYVADFIIMGSDYYNDNATWKCKAPLLGNPIETANNLITNGSSIGYNGDTSLVDIEDYLSPFVPYFKVEYASPEYYPQYSVGMRIVRVED